jgi:hypothetical protein
VALQAITATFAAALFAHPGRSAERDWDLHLQWYEAIRQSLLRWGQFPWWNPWCCGGFPLAAEPQVGLLAIDTPLVLMFGTSTGLRLAAVAYMMLAVEGTRRLARLWLADPWAVAVVAAVYGWNGAIIHYAVSGHALTMCYAFLPWMLLFAFRIGQDRGAAVLLGIVSAASVLTIVQYPTAYAMIITAIVIAWGFAGQPRGARARYAADVGLAAGIFLALAGWRVVLTGLVVADYPRKLWSPFDLTPWDMLHAALVRGLPPPRIYAGAPFVPEAVCYVGLLPVLAAFASLRRGWRWWHTLMFAAFAMAMGAAHWYQPSSWVGGWPVFSTMYMVGRWRIPAVLGLALAAGSELQAWRAAPGRGRAIAVALAAWVIADLALFAHQSLPTAFNVPPSEIHRPGPPTPVLVNLESWEFEAMTQDFEATSRGYGVIRGYCPLLGYDRIRRPTARLWRGHPDYVGESWSGGIPIAPVRWSPNRIELHVRPGQAVELNQNPGSWWWANGKPLFPGLRCAEPTRRFVAHADDQGWLRLEVRPRGLGLAGWVTVAGLLVAGLCWWLGRRAPEVVVEAAPGSGSCGMP